ncbi:MAG TPA: ParB/RepB/Spo0J family partition protein [Nitrospiria bacterium]|jgi:ParB family chromosome partitioning protein
MQRKPLGKGIGALFSEPRERESGQGSGSEGTVQVSVNRIHPNPYQPRKAFDEKDLSELTDSVKEKGVIQPLLVRKEGEHFELIAGERRWRAAKLAGLEFVPVMVREASGTELLELALVENIQRRDLNPIEAAKAFRQLVEEFGLTQEEIARRVGKDRSTITNTLRLLTLPVTVQAEMVSGRLSYGHAKVLLSMKIPSLIERTVHQIIQNGLSVRETEELLKANQKKSSGGVIHNKAPEVMELEEKLIRHLGTKVKVKGKQDRGRIILEYYSADDLDRLIETLLGK